MTLSEGEVLFSDDELKESFGDYIRRHREASGKTLDGISRTTRISKRFLQALEENDSRQLPDDAFARGFLKAYAKEVGLDVEDCVLRFDRFRKSLLPTQIKDVRKPPKMGLLAGDGFQPAQAQKWLIWGLSIGVVVAGLVAGVLLLIQALQREKPSAQKTEIEQGSETADNPENNVLEAPPVEAGSNSAVVKKAEDVPAAMTTPVRPSVLSIKAIRDTKLSIRVDENPLQELSFNTGDSRNINVFREVEIRSADRGAFSFQYNGKPLDISGPVIKLFNRHLYQKR